MSENVCKQRMLAKRWTLDELESLRNFYRQNMTLKHMSHLLGRTVTSINKMLDRQGIRQKRMNYDIDHRCKRFLNGYQNKNKCHKEYDQTFKKFWKETNPASETWVGLDDVISFLSDKGYIIERHNQDILEDRIIINGKSASDAQLLIEANRFREGNPMGPYYVEGLTNF
jgi:hypothetical protein